MATPRQIKEVRDRIGVGPVVAELLLTLAGDDIDLVERCSKAANGLDQCKALIVNERLSAVENYRQYN